MLFPSLYILLGLSLTAYGHPSQEVNADARLGRRDTWVRHPLISCKTFYYNGLLTSAY